MVFHCQYMADQLVKVLRVICKIRSHIEADLVHHHVHGIQLLKLPVQLAHLELIEHLGVFHKRRSL